LQLDLSGLSSVRKAADEVNTYQEKSGVLVNNADVMIPPLTRTVDGFDLQFGINHIAHFLLTNLLPEKTAGSPFRVVNISSDGFAFGGIRLEDPNCKVSYNFHD
jgi:NAD(P)-dependent dehydrogenase (short-subunit alcohol dehydrogenase family)